MGKSIDEMTVGEIEQYVYRRKQDEWQKKRSLELEAEKLFKSTSKIDIFEASDYCGMRNGTLEFYYGYEVTDDNGEWCFTAKENGIEVMRLPQSKLWFIGDAALMWCLLSGIGQYLQRESV